MSVPSEKWYSFPFFDPIERIACAFIAIFRIIICTYKLYTPPERYIENSHLTWAVIDHIVFQVIFRLNYYWMMVEWVKFRALCIAMFNYIYVFVCGWNARDGMLACLCVLYMNIQSLYCLPFHPQSYATILSFAILNWQPSSLTQHWILPCVYPYPPLQQQQQQKMISIYMQSTFCTDLSVFFSVSLLCFCSAPVSLSVKRCASSQFGVPLQQLHCILIFNELVSN